MAIRFAERPEVEFGDPPVAKDLRRRRWTIGRFMTELTIITVGAVIVRNWLAPADARYSAKTLLESIIVFLAARTAWSLFKRLIGRLNDACERACDVYWPMSSRTRRKPKTQDDL